MNTVVNCRMLTAAPFDTPPLAVEPFRWCCNCPPPPPPPHPHTRPTCAGDVMIMFTAPATAATSSDAGTPMSSVRAATVPAATGGSPLRLWLADTIAARSKL